MKPQRNKSILEEGNDVEEIMVLEKHRRHIKKVISPKMGYIEDKPEQQQQEENNDEFSKLFQDQ